MVVDVDVHPGFFEEVGEPADSAGLAGVDEHEPFDAVEVDRADLRHVEQVYHGADEEIPQVFFLGAGKDDASLGIELLGRQQAGQGIEVRIEMRGDDRDLGGIPLWGSVHWLIL